MYLFLFVLNISFEYFLKQATATNNDLGEYFTPRHIVKAIVNLVNPKFKETIYDPFCGTGGFLTEAFNHIKDNTITVDVGNNVLLKIDKSAVLKDSSDIEQKR